MLTAARNIWRKHRFLSIAFITALVVTVFFAARLVTFSLYWVEPAHQEQPVEGWMTPRYVALSYDLPPGVVREALDLEPEGERHTFEEIVESSSLTLEEIQRRTDEAVRSHKGDGE